jgi:ATP-binding cassette subfamily B protein
MHDTRTAAPRPPLGELAHLFSYVRPYRGRFLAAIVASTVSMAFGSMFPFLVGTLLDASVPSLKVLAVAPWQRDLDTVALVLLGTLLVQAALMFASSLTFHNVGERAVVDLREALYARLLVQPLSFFGQHRVGELSSRLSNDLAQIQDTLTFTVGQFTRQVMLLAAGLVMIAVTSVKLSLLMLCSVPVVMLAGVFFGRRVRKLSASATDRLADTAVIVEETLQGIASVKAFTAEPYEHARYRTGLRAYLEVILRTARHRAALIAFIIFAIFGAVVLVMWYGGHLMQRGELSHGELTRFILYTMFIAGGVSSLPEIISNVQRTLGATQRVRELVVLDGEQGIEALEVGSRKSEVGSEEAGRNTDTIFRSNEPNVPSAKSNDHRTEVLGLRAEPLPTSDFRLPTSPPRLRGDVHLDDLHFRYPARPELPVLRGISLHAAPGEKIALVGPSGAGKSTLVSLLLRFYEPDTGRILLDNTDARQLPLQVVRGNMAIVPQEVLLFGGTIRENIAYGRPGASPDEIHAAAERAHCHEFIARFPEGYDTRVGDRGVQLSGGQRQRIAIARALLKDPAVLILDEATSSLDAESEALIQRALDDLLAHRTAFIIAHRLATVRRADRIYVIENGIVTEHGTHQQLLDRPGGTYRRLSELQFTA